MNAASPPSSVVPSSDRNQAAGLRLYVAVGTPNSSRAEENLRLALLALGESSALLPLEMLDVFTQSKRAIRDGVIVTPTLIGFSPAGRQIMMGDLTDTAKLTLFLRSVLTWANASP